MPGVPDRMLDAYFVYPQLPCSSALLSHAATKMYDSKRKRSRSHSLKIFDVMGQVGHHFHNHVVGTFCWSCDDSTMLVKFDTLSMASRCSS